MEKDYDVRPLSESMISLKLAEIQKRCCEILEDTGSDLELTLEEPGFPADGFNPYDHA